MRYRSIDSEGIQRAVAGLDPRPKVLELHLSDNCQFSCSYCHSINQNRAIYGSNLPKPGIQHYKKALADFFDLGGQEVVFSGGGEPLLNSNILQIAQASGELGFRNHLYTNGFSELIYRESRMFSELFSTIRISIHSEYLLKHYAQLRRNLNSLTSAARSERTSIHLSFLVDTFHGDEELIESACCDLISVGVDAIEIRSTKRLHGRISTDKSAFFERLLDVAKNKKIQLDIRTDGINSSPRFCFATYSMVVIDPFFNLRVCCMRAHLGLDDTGNIANLFQVGLAEALALSISRMRNLGGRNCINCSSRLRAFSNTVAELLRAPTSERNK